MHFSSVYESDTADVSRFLNHPELADGWNEFSIALSLVYEKLKCLDVNKAAGPDKLPPLFFKLCAISLSIPLHLIYSESLRTGYFPLNWKLAHVVPIHKDGSQNDVRNYRPISKLSVPAKILDNILADEVLERLHDVIIPQQHGFFRHRSTVTNLASFTEKLQRCVDSGG